MYLNRRRLIRNLGLTVGALASAPAIANGLWTAPDEPPPREGDPFPPTTVPEPVARIASQIANNHGHAVRFELLDFLRAIRVTKDKMELVLDIQGQSTHNHQVILNQAALQTILLVGSLEVNSVGGSHSHGVKIELIIPAPVVKK